MVSLLSGWRTVLHAPLQALCVITAVLGFSAASAQDSDATVAPAPELRMRDFFRTPVGPKGLEISDALKQADGRTVSLVGYMVLQEKTPLGRFMLTPRPVQMSEHADGDADDLPPAMAVVTLDPTQQAFAVPYVRGLIQVSGVLHVGRFEESDGRVSWVRLQLAPDATRGMNAFEVASYLHSLQHTH